MKAKSKIAKRIDGDVENIEEETEILPQKLDKNSTRFDKNVEAVLKEIATTLHEKNESYGNSALSPIQIFSRLNSEEGLLLSIDHKLSRIARGSEFDDDDTILDLLGYLVLLRIARSDDKKTK